MRDKRRNSPRRPESPFKSTNALAGDFARRVPYLFLAVGPPGRALPSLQFGTHLSGRSTDRTDETTDRENEHINLSNNGQDFHH